MTEQQKAAVSIALSTLAGDNLAFDTPLVKDPIEQAIAHRELPPKDFKHKCVVVLYEAITRTGYFAE